MPSTPSNSKPLQHRICFEAIGTRWYIDTPTQIPAAILAMLLYTTRVFDVKWSRFRADSLVTQCRENGGDIPLDQDEYEMLQLYKQLYDLSDGTVTPLIGITLEDSGYDAEYSLSPRTQIRQAPEWSSTIVLTPATLRLCQPTLVDIGAAGKGLLVDKVASLLRGHYTMFTVDAGGDIYSHGITERIGLEHPSRPGHVVGTVTLRDAAICGSAAQRRAWGDMHHIIDARTSTPTHTAQATWGLAPSAMQADLIATALFFVSAHKLAHVARFQYVVMYRQGRIEYTHTQEIELYA